MRITIDKPISELLPLEVKCSHSLCEQGFHFLTSDKVPAGGNLGDCPDCGKQVVDWNKIYSNSKEDFDYKLDSLNKELLRHVCWCNDIGSKALEKAQNRGRKNVKRRAKEIIEKKINKIPTGYYDFLCTPKEGSEIIHFAQHATATCCRKCLERWHNIPMNRLLTKDEIDYCVELIEFYVDQKLPNLQEDGEVAKS